MKSDGWTEVKIFENTLNRFKIFPKSAPFVNLVFNLYAENHFLEQ